MRELKFSLDVETGALLCPNPSEWFVKSYIQSNVADNFRSIPGVKDSTKIAKNTFGSVLKAASCSWSPVDTALDAEEVDVCKLDVMVQVCQYEIESSFVSQKMAEGDSNFEEPEFLSHYWSDLQEKVAEEIQLLRWNGDTSLAGTNPLSLCNGYLVKLQDDTTYPGVTAVSGITATSFTSSNIIGAMSSVVSLLPEAEKSRVKDIRIYMSATNAFLYQLATLGLNSDFNYTGELPLTFAGYKIAVQPGMSNDFIVAGNKNSFVYTFDGEGDEKNLKIVNMMDSTAEPIIRTRVGLKLGFHILDGGNGIVYAKTA